MATEIERKFLVSSNKWKKVVKHQDDFCQGYLASNGVCSVRIRIHGDNAKLNIKSSTIGVSRHEYDYAIPVLDGHELLQLLCGKPLIEKVRNYVEYGDHTWEIDEFKGDNHGLVVAEIELDSEDESFEKPEWLGQEVTYDFRYYTVSLQKIPYNSW
jgi:adenylate cyclase